MGETSILFVAGFALIILGFILSFAAALIMFFRGLRRYKARSSGWSGLIMIGPIPIVFGTDREKVKVLIVLSIILMLLALVFIIALSLLTG
ncbi:MAG: DUF131 domain-containing protein [Candidatus Bathyarchaeota archaeon]|nr:DUF131 domain-containing protein [Candidatus Bathyarchaeota archaeon]